MDLQLAIIRSCLGDRCKICMLDNEAALEVRFDHRPSDSTRLRFGQLVAVDMCQAPAIVWRWHRASLLAWLPDTLLVCLPEGRLLWVGIGCVDPADLRFAPEVWVTQAGKGWEAHDAILKGAPVHPEQLLRWVERRPIPVAASAGLPLAESPRCLRPDRASSARRRPHSRRWRRRSPRLPPFASKAGHRTVVG